MDIVAHEVSNYFRLPYKPTPKQLLFHTTVAQYRLFGGAASGGKAEEVSQPILTTAGWTVFGALRAGDQVFGPDGLPRRVLIAHPEETRDSFSVRFDDGGSTVCSAEHLWVTPDSAEPVPTTAFLRGWDHWVPRVTAPEGFSVPPGPRRVTSVFAVGPQRVRCITVDHPDGLYLTGRHLIPTHNSYALRWECYAQCLAIPRWTALLLRRTSKMLEDNHISKVRAEMPPELATYNEQDGVLTFFNGSVMRFGHLQTEAHLQGYLGSEWGLVAPDELTTTLSFKEFTFLTSRNRNVNGRPNFAAATNPGGPSHAWVKSLWIDKKPFDGWPATGYDPDNFAYIPATIYDNPHLMEANPEYETILKNLPEALRAAYLDGSWDLVAGQYFDCWNLTQHVDFSDRVESPPWCERNIGIDWGFSHNSAVEWGVTDERAETLTVYRELVAPRMTPEQLGEAIVALTPQSERGRIANIYLSHDAHELRKEEFSIADQLGAVLAKNGLPWPQNARSSRVAGWVHMYEMLRAGQLKIHKSCQHLIGAIPELQRDPDCSDDVLKVDGDDAPDALRYLIQNRWGTGNPPFEVQVGRNFAALEETHGKAKDMNQVYIRQLMAKAQARQSPDRPFSLDRGGPKARGRRAGAWRFGR